jgi:hypothetical protein
MLTASKHNVSVRSYHSQYPYLIILYDMIISPYFLYNITCSVASLSFWRVHNFQSMTFILRYPEFTALCGILRSALPIEYWLLRCLLIRDLCKVPETFFGLGLLLQLCDVIKVHQGGALMQLCSVIMVDQDEGVNEAGLGAQGESSYLYVYLSIFPIHLWPLTILTILDLESFLLQILAHH